MPNLSERKKTLNQIDEVISQLYLQAELENEQSVEQNCLYEELEVIIDIKHMILSSRYFHERTNIPKQLSLRGLLESLPHYEFKQAVRVSKKTFQCILSKIENHEVFHNDSPFPQADIQFQLAVCLERFGCFGNGISCGRLARAYGLKRGTVSLYTSRVVEAILALKNKHLSWHNSLERQKTSPRFAEKFGMPGCVGVVDGTHIIILDPS